MSHILPNKSTCFKCESKFDLHTSGCKCLSCGRTQCDQCDENEMYQCGQCSMDICIECCFGCNFCDKMFCKICNQQSDIMKDWCKSCEEVQSYYFRD